MSLPKQRSTLQSPRLSKNLSSTLAPDEQIQDEGEYGHLRLTSANLAGQTAEHVTFKSSWFKQVSLEQTRFLAPKLSDLRFDNCDLANAVWERALFQRVEILGCRMTGFKTIEAHLQDVLLRDCIGALAQFRFATFKAVRFEQCNFANADFQGANLSGVRFVKCDLSNAEMSQTTLSGTDFRTSKIEGLKVGVRELPGAIMDHFQAAYVASLLGIVIKAEDED
ncbi:MAG: pentapeptide repeat-containing protein [Chloroflexi bacterium]|nr:pentapeptide repeat-containing protein [Chloroflexota bacterium]